MQQLVNSQGEALRLVWGPHAQVISLLKAAWEDAGLDLYLAPYGVLPTSYECGIVEVVPNCDSRSALGDTADGGLADIWRREFGAPGTARHEQARLNFIRSEAGCALAGLPPCMQGSAYMHSLPWCFSGVFAWVVWASEAVLITDEKF